MTAAGTIPRRVNGRGFGFITPDTGGEEISLHATSLQCGGFDDPTSGRRVEYDERIGTRSGRSRAVRARAPLDQHRRSSP